MNWLMAFTASVLPEPGTARDQNIEPGSAGNLQQFSQGRGHRRLRSFRPYPDGGLEISDGNHGYGSPARKMM